MRDIQLSSIQIMQNWEVYFLYIWLKIHTLQQQMYKLHLTSTALNTPLQAQPSPFRPTKYLPLSPPIALQQNVGIVNWCH